MTITNIRNGTEALQYLVDEFIARFGYSAEGCTDKELTKRAILILEGETGPKIQWPDEDNPHD